MEELGNVLVKIYSLEYLAKEVDLEKQWKRYIDSISDFEGPMQELKDQLTGTGEARNSTVDCTIKMKLDETILWPIAEVTDFISASFGNLKEADTALVDDPTNKALIGLLTGYLSSTLEAYRTSLDKVKTNIKNLKFSINQAKQGVIDQSFVDLLEYENSCFSPKFSDLAIDSRDPHSKGMDYYFSYANFNKTVPATLYLTGTQCTSHCCFQLEGLSNAIFSKNLQRLDDVVCHGDRCQGILSPEVDPCVRTLRSKEYKQVARHCNAVRVAKSKPTVVEMAGFFTASKSNSSAVFSVDGRNIPYETFVYSGSLPLTVVFRNGSSQSYTARKTIKTLAQLLISETFGKQMCYYTAPIWEQYLDLLSDYVSDRVLLVMSFIAGLTSLIVFITVARNLFMSIKKEMEEREKRREREARRRGEDSEERRREQPLLHYREGELVEMRPLAEGSEGRQRGTVEVAVAEKEGKEKEKEVPAWQKKRLTYADRVDLYSK